MMITATGRADGIFRIEARPAADKRRLVVGIPPYQGSFSLCPWLRPSQGRSVQPLGQLQARDRLEHHINTHEIDGDHHQFLR